MFGSMFLKIWFLATLADILVVGQFEISLAPAAYQAAP
jgi:hypothetical protein